MEGTIQKGELITYNLTELVKPEAYQVRLTPITRFGEGDSTERIIRYSGEYRKTHTQISIDNLEFFVDLHMTELHIIFFILKKLKKLKHSHLILLNSVPL